MFCERLISASCLSRSVALCASEAMVSGFWAALISTFRAKNHARKSQVNKKWAGSANVNGLFRKAEVTIIARAISANGGLIMIAIWV